MTALAVLIAVLVGVGVGHAVWRPSSRVSYASPGGGQYYQVPFGGSSASTPPTGGGSQGSGGPADVAAIAAKVGPALVDVNCSFNYQSAQGAGTGIVLTPTGEVLTNNHVINGATRISVTDVGNHRTYNASVVGYDPSHDIAVLQLQGATGLKTARIGDSSQLAVGQSVVGIGNAQGAGGAPASAGGSITGLNQSVTASDELDGTGEQLDGLIQVDAAIQSGDSGGSLVDSSGRVIGMDTAASQGFLFQSSGNQAYAIPINQALSTARDITFGRGTATVHVGPTAFLGVLISQAAGSGDQGGFFGGSGTSSGAALSGVVSGGSAAQAGLVAGDVITSLNGQSIDSSSALSKLMIRHHPGDKVRLGWTDATGQPHQVTAVLASGPPA